MTSVESLKRQKRFYELKLKKLSRDHTEYDETKKLYEKFKNELQIHSSKHTVSSATKSFASVPPFTNFVGPHIPGTPYATTGFDNVNVRIVVYSEDQIKGITLDANLFYHNLNDAKIKCKLLTIDKKRHSSFLPAGTHFIFSEYIPHRYAYTLLNHNKHVILVPNIDSYRQTTEYNFIIFLRSLSQFVNFHIFCKTQQIFEWLKCFRFKNLVYIPFCNNIDKFVSVNQALRPYFEKSEKHYRILLDTGGSTTKRKYFEEVVELFLKNPNIPFHLIVKTVPTLYQRVQKLLKRYPNYSNITFITKIVDYENLNFIYSQCSYFLYLAKYDGFGLALSKAKRHGLFIYCLNGKPWNEILNKYKKKKYITCQQDFRNKVGNKSGFAKSQYYYKVNFKDVLKCLQEPIPEEVLQYDTKQNNKESDQQLQKSLINFFKT